MCVALISGWCVCVCVSVFFLRETLDSRSVDKFLGAIENLPFEFGCPVFQHGSRVCGELGLIFRDDFIL